MTSKPEQSSKPLVLRKSTIWFDVDDTLVLWHQPNDYKGEMVVVSEVNDCSGMQFNKSLAVNTPMIEELKRLKQEGCCVVVWSWGGHAWAEAVVQALKLEEFVDVITDKPMMIYDDMSPSVWMPKPRHMLPDGWSMKLGGIYYTGTKEDLRAQWGLDYPGQKWEDTHDDEDEDPWAEFNASGGDEEDE